MTTIHEILKEINESNSSNYKLEVLKKYKDNALLKRVLKLTYDRVCYNFGIGKTTLQKMDLDTRNDSVITLIDALDFLENELATRKITGNAAIDALQKIFSSLHVDDRLLLKKIIERDLRINCGKTQQNKVFKDLITQPIYMRCDVYSKKTASKINFKNGAFIQKKADGMAIFINISESLVICSTRSGEEFILDSLQYLKTNKSLIDMTLQGEFTIKTEPDRAQANGLINSLIKYLNNENKTLTLTEAKIIEENIILELWDIFTHEEIVNAKNKIKNTITYKERFNKLQTIF